MSVAMGGMMRVLAHVGTKVNRVTQDNVETKTTTCTTSLPTEDRRSLRR